MGIKHFAILLLDAQRWSYISIAALPQMSLEQQALHFATLGFLLDLNLVERELERGAGGQPRLDAGELQSRWCGLDFGQLYDWELAWEMGQGQAEGY
jgi:hypothetical protein